MNYPVYFNLEKIEDAKISIHDLGFSRGLAVFDFLRTYEKVPFKLNEHLKRLDHSCRIVGLQNPLTHDQIKQIIDQILLEVDDDICIKIIVTGGENPVGITPIKPLVITAAQKLIETAQEKKLLGIEVDFGTIPRSFCSAKTLFYLPGISALLKHKNSGKQIDDILYVDETDAILESTTANFFMVKNNTLITPEKGVLEGITRNVVLNIAKQEHIRLEIRPIHKHELEYGDEFFITSTTREILPIKRIENLHREVSCYTLTRFLQAKFRKYVEDASKNSKTDVLLPAL